MGQDSWWWPDTSAPAGSLPQFPSLSKAEGGLVLRVIEHVPQVASTGEWDWLVQALHTAFSSLRESSSSSSAEALGLAATRRTSLELLPVL